MRFTFSNLDTPCLATMTDQASSSDGIFRCLGTSIIEFGATAVRDELEILIRIAECLSFLDCIINDDMKYEQSIDFMFQFESRFYCKVDQDRINVFDRENDNALVDSFLKADAVSQRLQVTRFVEENIANISVFTADRILRRDIL